MSWASKWSNGFWGTLRLSQGSNYFSPRNSGSKKTSHVPVVLKGSGTQYVSTQYIYIYTYIYICVFFRMYWWGWLVLRGWYHQKGFPSIFPMNHGHTPSFITSEFHIIRMIGLIDQVKSSNHAAIGGRHHGLIDDYDSCRFVNPRGSMENWWIHSPTWFLW